MASWLADTCIFWYGNRTCRVRPRGSFLQSTPRVVLFTHRSATMEDEIEERFPWTASLRPPTRLPVPVPAATCCSPSLPALPSRPITPVFLLKKKSRLRPHVIYALKMSASASQFAIWTNVVSVWPRVLHFAKLVTNAPPFLSSGD